MCCLNKNEENLIHACPVLALYKITDGRVCAGRGRDGTEGNWRGGVQVATVNAGPCKYQPPATIEAM